MALSKITDCHEHTQQEIQKQLQAINSFMQRMVEAEEKRQVSPMHGSSALLTNNANNLELSTMNYIKNLILEFLRFQGEDPTCWDYRANQFFSYHNTPEHQKVIMALYHLGGEALIWFQDFEQAGRSLLKLFKLILVLQPMMIPWRHLSLDSNKLQL